MSTQIPWILPLGLKPDEVEHWKLEIKPGESLTFRALEKGQIQWPTYQQWAMEYYQLPAVNDEYFREPASLEFWKLIQNVANWSPSLLPLEQWDGTIFIGCVEPPSTEIQWSFPVQFVLASPSSLKNRWQKYQQQESAPTVTIAPPIVTEPATEIPTIETPAEVAAEAPEGILLSPIETPPPIELNIPSEDQPVEEVPQAPEGLSFSLGEVKKVELAFDIEVGSGPSTPEAFLNQIKTDDAPTSPAESVPDVSIASFEAQIPQAPEDEALFTAFNEMKMFFDQSMYLKFDGQNFIPFKWNEGWLPVSGADQLPIATDTPSLFRIVVRTQHSYHGKIMAAPIHEIFFKNWGLIGIPDMATVIPIKVQGVMHGILLSVGPESSIESRALEHAEKVAGRLQQKFDQIFGSKVA